MDINVHTLNDYISTFLTAIRKMEEHISYVYDDRKIDANNANNSHNPTIGDG